MTRTSRGSRSDASLRNVPLHFPMPRKDDPGMWLKCGTTVGRATVKNGLNTGIAADAMARSANRLLLTTTETRPYNTSIRRAVRLRRDCAPLKLLTYVWKGLREVFGGSCFVGFWQAPLQARRLETARFPGCLTGESEERETWTAESLRTASSNGEGVGSQGLSFFREGDGHGRDFGGQRLRYIADRKISGWTSSNV